MPILKLNSTNIIVQQLSKRIRCSHSSMNRTYKWMNEWGLFEWQTPSAANLQKPPVSQSTLHPTSPTLQRLIINYPLQSIIFAKWALIVRVDATVYNYKPSWANEMQCGGGPFRWVFSGRRRGVLIRKCIFHSISFIITLYMATGRMDTYRDFIYTTNPRRSTLKQAGGLDLVSSCPSPAFGDHSTEF